MKITLEMLENAHAREPQKAIFAAMCPEGGEVTLAAARRAQKLGLDLHWAAAHLLSDAADKAYFDAIATADKVYDDATARAFVAACHVQDKGE